MDVSALGLALCYVFVLGVGAGGALLVLVWVFGEGQREITSTGRDHHGGSPRNGRFEARSMPPPSAGSERSEDEAA